LVPTNFPDPQSPKILTACFKPLFAVLISPPSTWAQSRSLIFQGPPLFTCWIFFGHPGPSPSCTLCQSFFACPSPNNPFCPNPLGYRFRSPFSPFLPAFLLAPWGSFDRLPLSPLVLFFFQALFFSTAITFTPAFSPALSPSGPLLRRPLPLWPIFPAAGFSVVHHLFWTAFRSCRDFSLGGLRASFFLAPPGRTG